MRDSDSMPAVSMGGRRWFTVEEAALYLAVSPNTIRNLIHRGDLKAARIGFMFRVERHDLDELMIRRKQRVPAYRKGTHPWVASRHAENRKKVVR
jgi:excisionase family DNA binding protein